LIHFSHRIGAVDRLYRFGPRRASFHMLLRFVCTVIASH
jgi:hypothetical protein